MLNARERQITARDLLLAYLDLRVMAPKVSDWTDEFLFANSPRLFRLKRLVALFKAFDIEWNPPSFADGDFIRAESQRYFALLESIKSRMTEIDGNIPRAEPYQLSHYFRILLEY